MINPNCSGDSWQWVHRAILLVTLLVFFGQMALGSTQLSLTSDEPPHTVHGYLLLKTGDLWAINEHRHPPLLNVWSVWPLLLQPEQPDVTTATGWHTDFVVFVRSVWPKLGPVDRWALVTRLPNMFLGVILMVSVYRWAKSAFGAIAALTAALTMAFDPTMVAHAQLNTTDIGTTLFTFAAVFWASYGKIEAASPRQRRWGLAAIAGILTGATAAAKGSGVIVAPIVLSLLIWREGRQMNRGQRRWFQRLLSRSLVTAIIVLIASLLTLWATYGFRLESTPALHMRLPLVAHVEMVRTILAESHRVAFLMGELRWGGWWWYFPFAFLIKTPLPILLLLVGAIASLLRRPYDAMSHLDLWLYPVFYMAISISSGMNIGYRHLLSILPFIYVMIAYLVEQVYREWRHFQRPATLHKAVIADIVLIGLLGWQIMGSLNVSPFGLAYFNELVGGPRNGYKYLVDSNYDWGQSFKALRAYLKHQGIADVWLSYYTWIDPVAYGITYRPLPPAPDTAPQIPQPYDPLPGTYALSATPLQGVMLADPDIYGWFRHREPLAQPGYGMLIYEVAPHTTEPSWLAQCTIPATPIPDRSIASGFGRDDLREISFDCTNGWILPDGGASHGWYALHAETVKSHHAMLAEHLNRTKLSYEQREPRTLPAFSLYEQQPARIEPPTELSPQVSIGPLTLLGSATNTPSARPGDLITIETWWRVERIPERSLSVMLHLGQPGQAPISIGDGLAISKDVWSRGDVLIQRHELEIPPDAAAGSYDTSTGIYWLDTLERLPVEPASTDDRTVRLSKIEVGERRGK